LKEKASEKHEADKKKKQDANEKKKQEVKILKTMDEDYDDEGEEELKELPKPPSFSVT
jgi:hypothetical protein